MFFFKVILLFLFVLFICCVWVPRRDLEAYCGSLVDKMERLKTVQGPKIVLIGDSNITFGMRSDLLEQAFGMPVVNMGYNSNMGMAFHEDLAKSNVDPGDIYILCSAFYDDDSIEPKADDILISTFYLSRDAWSMVFDKPWSRKNLAVFDKMIKAYPAYLKRHTQATEVKVIRAAAESVGLYLPQSPNPYSRAAFNEYGDIAPGKKAATSMEGDETFRDQKVEVPGPKTIERWSELGRWFSERGATLLIAGYPIAYGEYTPPAWEYEAAQKKIKAEVKVPLISNFADYMFEYELFYDNALHLTDKGAIRRTEQLIKDLRGWMEQSGYHAA